MSNDLALNKLDITRYKATDPGVIWLVANGYKIKMIGGRVFALRLVK